MSKNIYLYAITFLVILSYGCGNGDKNNTLANEPIKAYNIDYNWGPGGAHGFAKPGLWADADPKVLMEWYEDLGCNVVHSFGISCNGYAWYKNGFVPEQPGLKYDFLTDMVKIGRRKNMKVFAYFCVGANNKWEKDHPDLSYQMDGPQIPLTSQYLNYLTASIEDVIRKTDVDGIMLDWFYNPGGGSDPLPPLRWLPCEQEMYRELMNRPFPGKDEINLRLELKFRRKAIGRAWKKIWQVTKKTNPDCIIWLTANEVNSKEYTGSAMLQEVDWLMNEAGDIARTESLQDVVGSNTKLITCLANWNKQDPTEVVPVAIKKKIGLYGFAKPVNGPYMLPIDHYLSEPVDSLKGDERNIGVLSRSYNNFPLDYVKTN